MFDNRSNYRQNVRTLRIEIPISKLGTFRTPHDPRDALVEVLARRSDATQDALPILRRVYTNRDSVARAIERVAGFPPLR